MEVLNSKLKKRCINKIYKEQLSCIDGIKFLEENENNFSNFWLTTIVINEKSKIKNDDIRLYLESLNIESRPLWKPMHLQPVLVHLSRILIILQMICSKEDSCRRTNMSDEEINRVV